MRTLVCMSSAGGVGKTTTAINLAMAAARAGSAVLLVDAEPLGSVAAALNLHEIPPVGPPPGAESANDQLVLRTVLPGLDVLSITGDANGEQLAAIIGSADPEWRQAYDWAIVDAPTSATTGALGRLLTACDEVLLVLRLEPMAYRSLPRALSECRVALGQGSSAQFRGIALVGIPETAASARLESAIRDALESSVLSPTIPFDPEVARAALMGQAVALANPDAPASKAYRALAAELGMVELPTVAVEDEQPCEVEMSCDATVLTALPFTTETRCDGASAPAWSYEVEMPTPWPDYVTPEDEPTPVETKVEPGIATDAAQTPEEIRHGVTENTETSAADTSPCSPCLGGEDPSSVVPPAAALEPALPDPPERVARRADGVFNAVAVSPVGDRVAASAGDVVVVWDLNTRREILALRGHAGEAGAVTFSLDGRLVASGGRDRAILIWDAATGRLRATLTGHLGDVTALAFAPDGQTLASGSWDGTIKLWTVDPFAERATLTGHSDGVLAVAFSPRGDEFASGSEDGSVRIWSLADGRELLAFPECGREISAVAWTRDGLSVIAAGGDGIVRLWDVPTRREQWRTAAHGRAASALAVAPRGGLLATAGWDGAIKLWHPTTGELLRQLSGHDAEVTGLSFAPDGLHLVSSGWDGRLRAWETGAGREAFALEFRGEAPPRSSFAEIELESSSVAAAALETRDDSHHGDAEGTETGSSHLTPCPPCLRGERDSSHLAPPIVLLATGGADGAVRTWDAQTGDALGILAGHDQPVQAVAFSPCGGRLASAAGDRTVRVWEVDGGREQFVLRGHEADVAGLAFAPDGRFLASASWDTTVRLWDAAEGRECGLLRGHRGAVTVVRFSPDGRIVASGSWDKLVILWDLAASRVKGVIRGHDRMVTSLAFAPNGRSLATSGWDRVVRVWDIETGRELLELAGHSLAVSAVAFAPDGRSLATGGWNGAIKLWDLASGSELRRFHGHTESIRALDFDPTGQILTSASWDGTARLWDVATGEGLAVLRGHGDKVNAAAFRPAAAPAAVEDEPALWAPLAAG